MARYIVRGHACINGALHKNFEEIVEIYDPKFSNDYDDAVKAKHPDWESICTQSHEKL